MKFLLDANVVAEVGTMLAQLGHEVGSVQSVEVDVSDDRAVVSWCRTNGFVLLTHDRIRDRQTIEAVLDEMIRRGGRVLVIRGTPAQSPYVSVGKLLLHFEEWRPLLKRRAVIIYVTRDECYGKRPKDLLAILQKHMPWASQARASIRARKPSKAPPKRKPSTAQHELDFGAA